MTTPSPRDVCVHCRERPATMDWVGDGGIMAHIHGISVRWCDYCAVEAQLVYAKARAAEVADLERRFRELGGQP